MKILSTSITLIILLCNINVFSASSLDDEQKPDTTGAETNELLLNLGKYSGFDLSTYCADSDGPCKDSKKIEDYSHVLLNSPLIIDYQNDVIRSSIGNRLPNMENPTEPIIPDNVNTLSQYQYLNALANKPFILDPAPFDKKLNQIPKNNQLSDPEDQSLLNILTTVSQCDGDIKDLKYSCLSMAEIMFNMIGPFENNADGAYPAPNSVTSPEKNIPLAQQLNIDRNLLNPLLFPIQNNDQHSQNQQPLDTAMKLINYIIAPYIPLQITYKKYATLYATAANGDPTAQQKIISYLTIIRQLAAQKALPISNFYNALAKRLPIDTKSGSKTSQALSEYMLATWRLTMPASAEKDSWINKINKSSSLTVQKETAVLLSEINYQLYLQRLLLERLLLTNSVQVLQNTNFAQTNLRFDDNTNNSESENN